MRDVTEIEPTGRTVLACECGELLLLLGERDDWRAEGKASFECGACGSRLSLPDEGDEREQGDDEQEQGRTNLQDLSIGEYVRSLKAARSG